MIGFVEPLDAFFVDPLEHVYHAPGGHGDRALSDLGVASEHTSFVEVAQSTYDLEKSVDFLVR